MNTATAALEQGKDEMVERLRRLLEEAEQFVAEAAEAGSRELASTCGDVERQVRRLRTQLKEMEENAAHQARHMARSADDAVHRHPYAAIAMAAAAGLLVGFLASRR